MRSPDVERAAETHFFLRPVLSRALELQMLTDGARTHLQTEAVTYYDLWVETFADRWFDMATMIRLGTGVETGLREAYTTLARQPAPPGNVFQRLVSDRDVVALFKGGCQVDVAAISEWHSMREIMLHRHLYAHRSGLVDEKYLIDHAALTGLDIRSDVSSRGFPVQDVYWFRPLTLLPHFIEAARRFFRSLPV